MPAIDNEAQIQTEVLIDSILLRYFGPLNGGLTRETYRHVTNEKFTSSFKKNVKTQELGIYIIQTNR